MLIISRTTVSLLLLYKRIFVIYKKSAAWWLIEIILWSNVLFYVGMVLAVMFACTPVRKWWNPSLPGKCSSTFGIILVSAIWNSAATLVLLFLPIRFIWKLTMSSRRKLGVSAIFLVGIFACLASLMRLQLSIRNGRNPDVTYYLMPVMLWTVAEIVSPLPPQPTHKPH